LLLAGLLLLMSFIGCARRYPRTAPPPAPPAAPAEFPLPAPGPRGPLELVEEGVASWYGVPYHGRKSSNGEVYDMYKLTAAHRTLAFETRLRVTNLKNGKSTEVRITDRGPFVEGRVIDLSLAAARAIDMVADGVARVRLELISAPPPLAEAYTVQVGAFREKQNAVNMRQRLERAYQPVFVFEYDSPNGMFYRVRVGRVASQAAAERLAEKLRSREQIAATFVVRLDEP
jgi:rare lipoprotein A